MSDKKNTVRKTVSLDQELVDQCGMLFASAGADNFSQYVSMALEKYNDILISETQSSLLTNEMRGANALHCPGKYTGWLPQNRQQLHQAAPG